MKIKCPFCKKKYRIGRTKLYQQGAICNDCIKIETKEAK